MSQADLNPASVPMAPIETGIRFSHGVASEIASPAPSIRRSALWTGLGDAFYALCQWGILVILARMGTPEMVGQFALASAITAPVIIFANLGLRQLQSTDARNQFQFRDYVAMRLASTVLALATIAVLAFQYRVDTALTILVLGIAKCFEAISDVFYGLLQKHERMDLITISLLLRGVTSAAGFAVGFILLGGVLGGVVGLAMGGRLVLIAYDIPRGSQILSLTAHKPHTAGIWRQSQMQALCALALPLGVGTMLLSLNANIPRYFIERYIGDGALGLFAGMAYVAAAAGMAVNSLGQAMSPRLSQHWARGAFVEFRTLFMKFAALAGLWGLIGIGVAFAVGAQLLTLLYGADYATHSDTFVWLMGVAAVSHLASVCGFGMTAARIIRSQSIQFACVAAIGTVSAIVLIPGHGLNAAALAFGISLFAQLFISALCLHYALARKDQPCKS
ncbi:MAG TPA: lipopolysaccharide biosynthesis protein [Nitrospira sp.]|nr:lipopolysaccharide biosynthesis protein [Nitrospira sp.]